MDLNLEIVLLVAEQLELPTLSALMRTNSRMYSGILGYEQSICKTRIQSYMLPPTVDVVSTRTPEQEAYPRFSLDTIGELERRQRRITSIVNDKILSANSTIPEKCRPGYVAGLERALHICDHILDLGYQDSERIAQVEHIKTLPAVDLAFLFEAASLGSVEWARDQGVTAGDPDYTYKTLAFEDLVMRQGSMFLWGFTQGSAKFCKHSSRQINNVAAEIYEWEHDGEGHKLPSLRLAVIRTFIEKQKCTFTNFTQHMAAIVEREVKGPLPPAEKEAIKVVNQHV